MPIRKTHHFLQWMLAIFVVYLLLTRALISWVQFAPDKFVHSIEWLTDSDIQFKSIAIQQGWLGFQLQIEGLNVQDSQYELTISHINADVNTFAFLFPTMDYGSYLTLRQGVYQAKRAFNKSQSSTFLESGSEVDFDGLTQLDFNIKRLWKRVDIHDFVLSEIARPGLSIHIHKLHALKASKLNIVSEFGVSYKGVLEYERFSFKSSLDPDLWGGVDKGTFNLISFESLRVEKLAKLFPPLWLDVLPRGELIVDLSGKIEGANLSVLNLKLNTQALHWQTDISTLPKSIGLELDWSSERQGAVAEFTDWHFELAKMQIDNAYIEAVSPMTLYLSDNHHLIFKANEFDIRPFKLILASLITNKQVASLFDQTAELQVSGLIGRFNWQNLTLPNLQLDIKKLSIPVTDYPGLAMQNLLITKTEDSFKLETDKPVWLMDARVHSRAIRVDIPAKIELNWEDKDQWRLAKTQFKIDGMPFSIKGIASAKGEVDARLDFSIGNMSTLNAYMPYGFMHPNLQAWLKSGLVSGSNISGYGVLKGRLEDFPFESKNGLFEVHADVKNATLNFKSEWPALKKMDAHIKFTPYQLSITSDALALGSGVIARNIKVNILDLNSDDVALTAYAEVDTSFDRATQYLVHSPLAQALNLEAFITDTQFTGPVAVVLNKLWVPLSGYGTQAPKVSGQIQFKGAEMTILEKLPIHDIKGTLSFSEHHVAADNIRVQVLGGGADVNVRTDPKSNLVKITGAGRLFEAQNRYFDGKVPWRLNLKLPFKTDKPSKTKLALKVDLTQARSLLPAPFTEDALKDKTLDLSVTFLDKKTAISGKLPGLVVFEGLLGQEGAQQRDVQFNVLLGDHQASPQTVTNNLSSVNGVVDSIDVDSWLELYQGLEFDLQGAGFQSKLNWGASRVAIKQLAVATQHYKDLSIQWAVKGLETDIQVVSDDLSGQVILKKGAPIVVNVNRLRVKPAPIVSMETGQRDTFKKSQCMEEPKAPAILLPEFVFKGQDINIKGYQINTVNFTLKDSIDQLLISAVKGSFGQSAGEFTGQYFFNKTLNKSQFNLGIKSSDVQAVMTFLQMDKGFSGRQANIGLQLNWNGSLLCANKKAVTGQLSYKLKEGVIEDVEPGIARLLGLLSIEALSRRIKLDLKDVTNKGMVYDSIEGAANLSNGKLYLEEFKLKAPAASVVLTGSVDMIKETFDLKAAITPALGASLPALVTLAGSANPLTAIAIYTLMKIIPGINENLITYHYLVTGPWETPILDDPSKALEELEAIPPESILDFE